MSPTPERADSSPPQAAPSDSLTTPSPAGRAAAALSTVTGPIRLHNLFLLIAFVTAMTAVTYKLQTHARIESTTWLRVSEVVRILGPLAALILTGLFTSRRMEEAFQTDREPSIETAAPIFAASKRRSTWLLGLALIVNVAFLAVGSRVADFLLAGVPALLFITTRPSSRGLIAFTAMLQTVARQRRPQPTIP